MSLVECIRRDQTFEIVLGRPELGNALNSDLVCALHEAVDQLSASDCTTVLFRGKGTGFCGGFDLRGLEDETDASLTLRFIQLEMLLQRIANLPKSTIAMAHGFAFGAGADLVLACRRRIAAPDLRMSFPGVRFGIALGTARLGRLIGADKAWNILARVSPIGSEDALALGLITEIVANDEWGECDARIRASSSSLDRRIGEIVKDALNVGNGDADLGALARSLASPSIRDRLIAYRAALAQERAIKREPLAH